MARPAQEPEVPSNSRRRPEKEPEVQRKPRRPAATTAEARERQLIAQANDLAERQIRQGNASAAVITHFLKLGSTREKYERERLENENQLLRAKVDQLASAKNVEQLYSEALQAMRAYSGQVDPEDEDYDY
jgi:hypothetical protein